MVIIITDEMIMKEAIIILNVRSSPATVEPSMRAITGFINVLVETRVGLHFLRSQM